MNRGTTGGWRPWAAGLLALFAAVACDVGDDDDGDDDQAAPIDFATFNAGLARGYVPYADQRLPRIEDALGALDVDALCLEEVWTDADVAAVAAALAQRFPALHRHDSTRDWDDVEPLPPACDDLADLRNCADEHCPGLPPDELTQCVLTECADEIAALPEDCTACLAANVDKPFDEIEEICTSPGPPPISYGGSNGLMLFAAKALTDLDWLQLDFFLVVRVVLHATMATDAGPVHLFCTHLTAGLDEIPYAGEYGSYEAEQSAQITAMLGWVDEKAGDEAAVLLGDFNTGPETDGVTGEFPANYATIVGAGFDDPYVRDLSDVCTWCGDNPLTGGGDDHIIDHVFVRGLPGTFSAARMLDQEITIDVDGEPTASRLSDHYGVRVTAAP